MTNACLDRKRGLRRLLFFGSANEMDVPDRQRSMESRYIREEMERSVRKVIARMPPKLRMAVLLKYFEDLSYREMAVALGCSEGTLASRLNRANQIMARKLSHYRDMLGQGDNDV